MKSKITALCLAFLLAAQLCIPASAAETADEEVAPPITAGEPTEVTVPLTPSDTEDKTNSPIEEPEAPNTPEVPDEPNEPAAPEAPAESDELVTVYVEPQPGEPGLFQCGAFSGPQTIPGEVELMADSALYTDILNGLKKQAQEIEKGSTNQVSIDVSGYRIGGQIVTGSDGKNYFQPNSPLISTFYKVINDHPEYFYLRTGYSISYNPSTLIVSAISPEIITDFPGGVVQAKKDFDTRLETALAQINGVTDPVEKCLLLHDYLILNCKYNHAVASGQKAATDRVYSSYGVLVDQDAVCQGYSLAYKLLLQRAGITCIVTASDSMNHAWNLVQLNNNWYHVDVTHDDPVSNDYDTEGVCKHTNFLRTDSEIRSTNHKDWYIYADYNSSNTAPTCNDTTYTSGWIFNNNPFSVYRRNNSYYSIKLTYSGNAVSDTQICKSNSLSGTPTSSASIHSFVDVNRGVVWHGNYLYSYYWDDTFTIIAIPLEGNNKIQIEGINPRGATGLRYENGNIVASSGNQNNIASFPVLPDNLTLNPSAIAKFNDHSFIVPTSLLNGKTLWTASYNNDKMIDIQQYTAPTNMHNSTYIALSPEITSESTRTTAFLLNSQFIPACPAA